jgi:phospholipase C
VPPPQLDAYGIGIRIPTWVISPFAKKGPIETSLPNELVSTVKLLEALHGIPTLASQNHLFDNSTPTGSNYEANGAPAPRRARGHQRHARLLRLLGPRQLHRHAIIKRSRDIPPHGAASATPMLRDRRGSFPRFD